MKLVSCYIENFGRIKARAFDFDGRVTAFCEENGFGKTTLAMFIKAMFYGLPASRSNSKDFDDRQHFFPFDGGKFGGNLTFESGGRTYRVERFFGRKSAVNDECRLFVNGRETQSSGNIGREIFGLDEASFMRTVFISSDDDVSATAGINAKLNNFVDDTENGADFERALAALDKAKKRYRAARGGGGRIAEQKAVIAELKSAASNLKDIGENLGTLYARREKIAESLAEAENKLKIATGENLTAQKWQTYDTFTADAEEEKSKFEALCVKYAGGLPDGERIKKLSALAMECISAQNMLETTVFSSAKERELGALNGQFSGGVPDGETLKETRENISALLRTDAEIDGLKSAADGFCGDFACGIPEKKEMDLYRKKAETLRDKSAELKIPPTVSTVGVKGARTGANKALIILAALAAVLLGVGAGLLFVSTVAGVIILVAGALFLVGCGFFYLKGQMKGMGGSAVINAQYAAAQAEITQIENEIKNFLARYGRLTDRGAEADFYSFERDIEAYNASLTERTAAQAALAEKSGQKQALLSELNAFFEKYRIEDGDFQERLSRLQADMARFTALMSERDGTASRRREMEERIESNLKKFDEILAEYGISRGEDMVEQLTTLDADVRETERLKKSVQALTEKAEAFGRDNNLSERPDGEIIDTDLLSDGISELRTSLTRLDGNIAADEDAYERLQDKCSRIPEAKNTLESYEQNYAVLSCAMQHLERAESNLKDRYIAPVRDRFVYYSEMLERALGDRIMMDENYKVYFERGGEMRSDRHLSAGQRNLCMLCLRLALIDNMYEGEKPFIVLDDPFTNLDEAHTDKALALIKELSEDKQIIYFCCHESRMIKA